MSRIAALFATCCCVAALSACAQNRTTEGSAPINAEECSAGACSDGAKTCSDGAAKSCSEGAEAKKACCSESKPM